MPTLTAERSHAFQVRLTPEEVRMLEALAESDGISASGLVRLLVRREFRARGLGATPTKVTRKGGKR
jgi:hypothetical protein